MDVVKGLLNEIWILLLAMSPYLIFGFALAGVLKVLIPDEFLLKHLSGKKWTTVFKAAFAGVPLPLCSCGVIPVTAHLKKSGAGRGAVIAFLTTTPTTGIDSILATFSLLGWGFALVRIVASFFIGIIAGLFSNLLASDQQKNILPDPDTCTGDCMTQRHFNGVFGKIKDILEYAYVELVDDIGKWLVIGIVAGGVISYFVPTEFVQNYLSNPLFSYPLMLLLAIPTYVCATGSIAIAASLIIKGMNPGAGLVFLIAGPATNAATVSFVGGKLGKKTLFIYLSSIIIGSVTFGVIMDIAWPGFGHQIRSVSDAMDMLPYWLEFICAVALVIFIFRGYVVKMLKIFKTNHLEKIDMKIKVSDITCEHCKRTIEKIVLETDGVEKVLVDVKTKMVEIQGNPNKEEIYRRIRDAGYTPE